MLILVALFGLTMVFVWLERDPLLAGVGPTLQRRAELGDALGTGALMMLLSSCGASSGALTPTELIVSRGAALTLSDGTVIRVIDLSDLALDESSPIETVLVLHVERGGRSTEVTLGLRGATSSPVQALGLRFELLPWMGPITEQTVTGSFATDGIARLSVQSAGP